MLMTSKTEMRMWESDEKTLSVRVQFQFYVDLTWKKSMCTHIHAVNSGLLWKKYGNSVLSDSYGILFLGSLEILCFRFVHWIWFKSITKQTKQTKTKTKNDNVSNNDIFGWEREVSKKKKKNQLQIKPGSGCSSVMEFRSSLTSEGAIKKAVFSCESMLCLNFILTWQMNLMAYWSREQTKPKARILKISDTFLE